jgi:hypothetical protein
MLLIVHLRIGLRWNPSLHYESFHITLFQLSQCHDRMVVMLSKQDDGRSRVVGTTHNRAPSHDGGSVVGFLLMNGKLHETDTGRGN